MANDYDRQVAAVRQQKIIEDAQVDYNQAVYGRQEALANRQEIEQQYALTSDPAEHEQLKHDWHYYDAEVQRCEQDIRARTPQPRNPNIDRANYQDQEFYRREGQNGAAAMRKGHDYLVSRGWAPGTPQTIEGTRTLVEMYGKDPNISGLPPVRYEPSEQMPTRDEAAQMSGFKDYVSLYQELKRQGRVK